jgi:hypothetical protein
MIRYTVEISDGHVAYWLDGASVGKWFHASSPRAIQLRELLAQSWE